MPGSLAGAAAS